MTSLTALLPSGDSSTTLLVLDPREAMIEGIAENSEALLATFEKTLKVSQQHQAQQKQTIATIAKKK
jgi:hypothetical protein